jgi:hypothetical protein
MLERLPGSSGEPRPDALTAPRVRQIIARMLESCGIVLPADFARLQIARLSKAMIVARTVTGRAMCARWIDGSNATVTMASRSRAHSGRDANCRRRIRPDRSRGRKFSWLQSLEIPRNGIGIGGVDEDRGSAIPHVCGRRPALGHTCGDAQYFLRQLHRHCEGIETIQGPHHAAPGWLRRKGSSQRRWAVSAFPKRRGLRNFPPRNPLEPLKTAKQSQMAAWLLATLISGEAPRSDHLDGSSIGTSKAAPNSLYLKTLSLLHWATEEQIWFGFVPKFLAA